MGQSLSREPNKSFRYSTYSPRFMEHGGSLPLFKQPTNGL
jgi:hypothetical protein